MKIGNTIDFISNLPIEIAEELIISYLDGVDILICCKVCRRWKQILDQNHIWKRLCDKNGWAENAYNTTDWRNLYWINHNWSKGRYRQFTINGDDLHPAQHRSFHIDGHYLIVPRATSLYKSTGINIWDLRGEPKLHQIIFNELGPKGKQFKAYKYFIVQQIGTFIRVHKNINGKYKHFKLLHFKENIRFNDGIFQVVSDVEDIKHVENFTTPIFEDEVTLDIEIDYSMLCVHKLKKYIYLWRLDPWKPLLAININGEAISSIRIVPDRLFCIMSSTPIIRIYDVLENNWLLELNCSSINPFNINPTIPTLYLGPDMISSYYKNNSESLFKIWNSKGELRRVTELPRNLHFQCIFTDECIILTSAEQTISILSYDLNEIKKIQIDSPCEGIDKGQGQYFIIVYQTFYQIWDWKTGKKKYTIDLPMSLVRQNNTLYCAYEIHQYNHKIKINVVNFSEDVKTSLYVKYKRPKNYNCSRNSIDFGK